MLEVFNGNLKCISAIVEVESKFENYRISTAIVYFVDSEPQRFFMKTDE